MAEATAGYSHGQVGDGIHAAVAWDEPGRTLDDLAPVRYLMMLVCSHCLGSLAAVCTW